MAIYAGAFTEVTYNNPTAGSGTLNVMVDEDANVDYGGLRTDEEVKLDSSNQAVYNMTPKPWKVDATFSNDFNGTGTAEQVNALAAALSETDFTFAFPSGSVYSGKGRIVGDISGSVKGTVALVFSGGGKLAKQA